MPCGHVNFLIDPLGRMLKKIILTFLLFTTIILPMAFMFVATETALALDEKEFFDTFSYTEKATEGTKIGAVKSLPKGNFEDVLASVIKTVLGIVGSLAFISFTYAGIMFITAQGDETKLSKAKKLIFWSFLALAIIATSYAIVLGVSQLKF